MPGTARSPLAVVESNTQASSQQLGVKAGDALDGGVRRLSGPFAAVLTTPSTSGAARSTPLGALPAACTPSGVSSREQAGAQGTTGGSAAVIARAKTVAAASAAARAQDASSAGRAQPSWSGGSRESPAVVASEAQGGSGGRQLPSGAPSSASSCAGGAGPGETTPQLIHGMVSRLAGVRGAADADAAVRLSNVTGGHAAAVVALSQQLEAAAKREQALRAELAHARAGAEEMEDELAGARQQMEDMRVKCDELQAALADSRSRVTASPSALAAATVDGELDDSVKRDSSRESAAAVPPSPASPDSVSALAAAVASASQELEATRAAVAAQRRCAQLEAQLRQVSDQLTAAQSAATACAPP